MARFNIWQSCTVYVGMYVSFPAYYRKITQKLDQYILNVNIYCVKFWYEMFKAQVRILLSIQVYHIF